MKITKSKLKQIIKEEYHSVLEQDDKTREKGVSEGTLEE